MWVGQAGGFGGGRGLHSHTDRSQLPELSRSDLLSSQGDASKRSGRLDPTLLSRAPWGFLKLDFGSKHKFAANSIRGSLRDWVVKEHMSHQC
jgi:hypothetical protein